MSENETADKPEGQSDEREIVATKRAVGAKAARAAQRKEMASMHGDDTGPIRVQLPDPKNREMFAIADQLLGASKLIVMCEDGKSRMARIPGKMKRRQWIKPGDLIVVRPWDIDDDKADVKLRYIRTQAAQLSRRGIIPDLLDHGFS